jgi:hypothetical protein
MGLASIPADFSSNSAAAASARTVRLADGTLVPALGQGSWHLGQMRHPIEAEEEAMRVGISLGLTLIDTAEAYGNGLAEEMIGRVITGQRDHVFIVSKVLPSHADPAGMRRACARSCEKPSSHNFLLCYAPPLASLCNGVIFSRTLVIRLSIKPRPPVVDR